MVLCSQWWMRCCGIKSYVKGKNDSISKIEPKLNGVKAGDVHFLINLKVRITILLLFIWMNQLVKYEIIIFVRIFSQLIDNRHEWHMFAICLYAI